MTILDLRRFATRLARLGPGVLLLLVWLPATPAGAQQRAAAGDLFTARDVPVDETAATAAEAREIAIRDGQRQALTQVMQRLTPQEEHARLPQPSDSEIAAMVANIQIEDEKTSATRYLSKLTVDFKRDAVRELLRRAAIPFSEAQAGPRLVLPVVQQDGAFKLFDETNAWWHAWRELELRPNSLLPLVLPLGDLEDITAVSPEQALSGDRAALRAIGARYGAEGVVVALASPRRPVGSESIAAVEVSLRRYQADGTDPAVDSFTAAGGEDPAAVMTAAASQAVTTLTEAWKRQTLLQLGGEASLSARVPLRSLEDWVAVRERLTRSPSVRRVELTAMSRQGALIMLDYLGPSEQLAAALAQEQLTLEQGDGFWTIRLAGAAPATPGLAPATPGLAPGAPGLVPAAPGLAASPANPVRTPE